MTAPPVFPETMDVNGAALHVHRVAASVADAPTLVLVNSLGCDLRIWSGVTAQLVGRAEIVCYDKRGHGLSEIGATPYAMRDHADDLVAIIEATGARAHVCGLSIGGMIAMLAALERPELIAGLILCDTAARIGSAERYAEREATIRAGGMEGFAEAQMERWFSPRFREAHSGAVRAMRAMLVRQPVEGYLGSVAALRDTDLRDRVGALRVPTLCLVGAEDASTPPAMVRALADAIPDARYAEIENAGHLPPVEAPGAVARAILSSLAGRA